VSLPSFGGDDSLSTEQASPNASDAKAPPAIAPKRRRVMRARVMMVKSRISVGATVYNMLLSVIGWIVSPATGSPDGRPASISPWGGTCRRAVPMKAGRHL